MKGKRKHREGNRKKLINDCYLIMATYSNKVISRTSLLAMSIAVIQLAISLSARLHAPIEKCNTSAFVVVIQSSYKGVRDLRRPWKTNP